MADPVRDLLWSLWTEMGVPGAIRQHQMIALDPEVLIVHTPALTIDEPRLLGLAFDWCRTNAARLSKTRIEALARALPDHAKAIFSAFTADLAQTDAGPMWRPLAGTLGLSTDRELIACTPNRPAHVRFRIRAIAGVSTRSEVLARLLETPSGAVAAHLKPAGVSRPSVDRELAQLLEAGITVADGPPRGRRHRLRDRSAWLSLLGAADLTWVDWDGVFDIVATINALQQMDPNHIVTRVSATKARERLAMVAAGIGAVQPPRVDGRGDAVEAMVAWSAEVVERL